LTDLAQGGEGVEELYSSTESKTTKIAFGK
jgi:hypothetical protein